MRAVTDSNAIDLLEPQARLWVLAVVFFGVGDLVTTMLGLTIGSSAEANPFVAMLVDQYGVLVLLPLKMAMLGGCYVGWKQLPLPYPIVVPLVLALLGIVVTIWNTGILLTGSLT
jgi:hypothetical protein